MKGFKVARIAGIDIELHWSWILIFAYFTYIFATTTRFPPALPGVSVSTCWIFGILTSIILFASVVFHELGHSLVAKHFKIPVQRITLFFLGGLAQMKKEPESAWAEFWMALAGPLSSLVLAGGFFWLTRTQAFSPIVLISLANLTLMNGALAIFNMIPGFPLDGGRVFRAIVWGISRNFTTATKWACKAGEWFGYLFIASSFILMICFLNLLGAIWLLFIGFFLEATARGSWQQHRIQTTLAGVRIKDLTEGLLITDSQLIEKHRQKNWICHPDQEVLEVLEKMQSARHPEFLVIEKDKVLGRITLQKILSLVEKI